MPERDCIKLARIAGAFGGICIFLMLSRHGIVGGLVFGFFCGMAAFLAAILISLSVSALIRLFQGRRHSSIFPCGIPKFKERKRERLRLSEGKLPPTIAPADSGNRPMAESLALLSKVKTWNSKSSAPKLAGFEPHRLLTPQENVANMPISLCTDLVEEETIPQHHKVIADVFAAGEQVVHEVLEFSPTKLPSEEQKVFREELFDASFFADSPAKKPARKRRTQNLSAVSLSTAAPAPENEEWQMAS